MEVKVGIKMDIPLPLFYPFLFTLLPFKAIVQHKVLNFPFYFLL